MDLPTFEQLKIPEKVANDLINLVNTYNGWPIGEIWLSYHNDELTVRVVTSDTGTEIVKTVK